MTAEPFTPAEIAVLRTVAERFNGWALQVWRGRYLRLLDSHEALRQRADAAERAGMERATEIAQSHTLERPTGAEWGLMNDDDRCVFFDAQRCHEAAGAAIGIAIRAATPAAAAKDEVR